MAAHRPDQQTRDDLDPAVKLLRLDIAWSRGAEPTMVTKKNAGGVRLSKEDFDRLAGILAKRFRGETGRTDFLDSAFAGSPEKDEIFEDLDLAGTPRRVSKRVINRLIEFGQVEDGREALELMIDELLAGMGKNADRNFLEHLELYNGYPLPVDPERPAKFAMLKAIAAATVIVLAALYFAPLSSPVKTLIYSAGSSAPAEVVVALVPDTPTSTVTPTVTATLTLTATATASATPAATATPTAPPSLQIAVTSANVHAGPGEAYDVLTTVESGAALQILARSDGAELWYNVLIGDGQTGWVSSTAGEPANVSGGVPLAATIPPLPTPTSTRIPTATPTYTVTPTPSATATAPPPPPPPPPTETPPAPSPTPTSPITSGTEPGPEPGPEPSPEPTSPLDGG